MEDDEWANKVRADALIHQPTGLVVDDIELVDEDGVVLAEAVVPMLGTIAQQGGFMFDNLSRVALLMPRSFGPVASVALKFDACRDFHRVRKDSELAVLIRAWTDPKYSKSRRKVQRDNAIKHIHKVLSERIGATMPQRRLSMSSIGTEGNELAEGEEEMEEYEAIDAMQGLWELALHKSNFKSILRTEHDVIKQLARLVGMESSTFQSDMAVTLAGTMWAMSINKAARLRMSSLSLVPLVFTILFQQNLLHEAAPPLSHVYSLGALRALLEVPANHNFLLLAARTYDIDILKFLAVSLCAAKDRQVWDHLSAIILRSVARNATSLSLFLNDYVALDGQPSRIVGYFADSLTDISAFARPTHNTAPPAHIDLAAFGGDSAGRGALVMDTGARLAVSVLFSCLSTAGSQGRSLLLDSECSGNNSIQSLLRWAIHTVAVGDVASAQPLSTMDVINPLMENDDDDDGDGDSLGSHVGEEDALGGDHRTAGDLPTFFDALYSMLLPTMNPGDGHGSKRVKSSKGDSLLGPARDFAMIPARNSIPRAPDLDGQDVMRFSPDEWLMTSGRAHEATLLNAALALWGLAKSIAEAKVDHHTDEDAESASNEDEPKPAVLPVETERLLGSMPDSEGPAPYGRKLTAENEVVIGVGAFRVSTSAVICAHDAAHGFASDVKGDMPSDHPGDGALASLLSLVLAMRSASDQKPGIEISAMSAINALAHANNFGVRRRMARLHEALFYPPSTTAAKAEDVPGNKPIVAAMVLAERRSELGANYSRALTEVLLNTGELCLHHPVLDADLRSKPSSSHTAQVYGMSALSGILSTCAVLELPASAALPYLDVQDLIALCSNVLTVSKAPGGGGSPKNGSSRSGRSFKVRRSSSCLRGLKKAPEGASIITSAITRSIASACLMLHAFRPRCDPNFPDQQGQGNGYRNSQCGPSPPQQERRDRGEQQQQQQQQPEHETDPSAIRSELYPQWNAQACEQLLRLLGGRIVLADDPENTDGTGVRPGVARLPAHRAPLGRSIVVVRPNGTELAYTSLAVWSLAREYPLRMACLRAGYLPVLVDAAHLAIEMVEAFCAVDATVTKNTSNILKMQRETRRVLRTPVSVNVRESTEEARARNLRGVREHFFALNAVLCALWQLCMNRDVFNATVNTDSRVEALMVNLETLSEERAILKKTRAQLFQLLLRVLQAVCIGTEPRKREEIAGLGLFNFAHGEYKEVIDSITHKAASLLWCMASLRVSDKALCEPSLVQTVLDLVYNDNVSPQNRCLLAQMLCYVDRLPARSETSATIRKTFESMVSATYLCEIVMHFLGSDEELLRSEGADLLGKIRSTRIGQALVRNSGGIALLLRLTREGTSATVVLNALKGLRHVSLDPTSQEHLCRQGLYHLLQLSWTSRVLEHRRVLAQILKQLSENSKNKTLMYKAEMRARQMLGWRNVREPTEEERTAYARQLEAFKAVQDTPATSAKRSEAQVRKNFKGEDRATKTGFLSWLKTLRVEEASEEAARSYIHCNRIRSPHVPPRLGSPKKKTGRPTGPHRDPTLRALGVNLDDDEESKSDKSSTGEPQLKRTLSSFLQDFWAESDAADAAAAAAAAALDADALCPALDVSPSGDKDPRGNKAASEAIPEIIVPRITISTARLGSPVNLMKPQKPSQDSPGSGAPANTPPTSPRKARFKTMSPHESPLWNMRDHIHYPGKSKAEKQSPRATTKIPSPRHHAGGCSNGGGGGGGGGVGGFEFNSQKDVTMSRHSDKSPFSAAQHRAANQELTKRMCQPARALWAPDHLYTNVGKQRWHPQVREITVKSPREVDREAEFLRSGVLLTDEQLAAAEAASLAKGYQPKRVDEITVKLESSRPYSQFVFQRGGDPLSMLRSWEDIDLGESDSDTSLSSYNSHESDSDAVSDTEQTAAAAASDGRKGGGKDGSDAGNKEAVAAGETGGGGGGPGAAGTRPKAQGQPAKSQDGVDGTNSKSSAAAASAAVAEKEARRHDKLLRKKRRKMRRRHAQERERRRRTATQSKRAGLSKFVHVEGAKIYEELPRYQLPDGQEIFLYLSGGPFFGRDKLQDVCPPPIAPQGVEELGFPYKRLPSVPRLHSHAEHLPTGELQLPTPFLPAPPPKTHSLTAFGGRQPDTQVAWMRLGKVLDEPMPIQTAYADDLGDDDGGKIEEEPWGLESSVFAWRGKAFDTFYNDKQVRNKAFECDWQLCEQKRTFRKFLSRYETCLGDLKGVLKLNYGAICNIFRYYSALDQIQSVFAMQMLEFTDFCSHSNIKETDPDSLIQEGHCNTIFIQVTKNPIEDWTEDQMHFENECKVLSLKRGAQLMRYQFLEALVRVAEAKFVKSGQVTDIALGCQRLFQVISDCPLMKRMNGCFDSFRKKQLYCESVDLVLRDKLGFLKGMFLQFAGTSEHSREQGGYRGKRMTFGEWQTMLLSIGLFNPLFTLRESNNIFRSSTLDVADEIKNWRQVVSLMFVDFLEAIARTATVMVVPTDFELEEVGADDIVDYYRIMESTGLWLIMNEKSHQEEAAADAAAAAADSERAAAGGSAGDDVEIGDGDLSGRRRPSTASTGSRPGSPKSPHKLEACLTTHKSKMPLWYRLEQFILLLEHMKDRSERMKLENKLWKADPKKMTEEETKRKEEEDRAKLQSLKTKKKVTSPGMVDSVLRDHRKSRPLDVPAEPVPEGSLQEALAKVEAGIPMDRFEVHVAATLHDVWRENRGKLPGGTYVPRVKVIKNEEFDIANLAFAELPGHFQMDNLLAAHDACESIRHAFEEWDREERPLEQFYTLVESAEFLEAASASQHDHWLKRNAKKAWVESHQKVPWEELGEEDRGKNRDIVLTAVKVWLAHQQKRRTVQRMMSARGASKAKLVSGASKSKLSTAGSTRGKIQSTKP